VSFQNPRHHDERAWGVLENSATAGVQPAGTVPVATVPHATDTVISDPISKKRGPA
jgi:hypothetical protein